METLPEARNLLGYPIAQHRRMRARPGRFAEQRCQRIAGYSELAQIVLAKGKRFS